MLKKFKKIDWGNLLERAFHSFWQGCLASLIITGFSENELKVSLTGALVGGLSALKTFITEMLGSEKDGN